MRLFLYKIWLQTIKQYYSMMKKTIQFVPIIAIAMQGFTYDGNLAIESDNHVEKNPWWDNFYIQNGAYITKTGESKTVIEVCTGTKNNGNEGEEPKDPDYPIIVDDTRNYAYLFEDQRPLYGD